jgi:ribose-phosphate pyrophosphokinase
MQVGELKVLSGQSNPALVEEICSLIGTTVGGCEVGNFPDGETSVKITENIRGKDIFIIQSSCTPANNNIMELLIIIDAARRASAQRITAVIPFFGYARQDRKDQPRVPITAKLIANLLVTAGANRILTIDLHAQQIQGFFDIPVDHLYASPVFFDYLKQIDSAKMVIFAPDVGGVKMAAAYADMFGCALGFVAKRRTSATTVEAFNLVGEVEGREVLIIDDMTETTGTLCAAANLLKDKGATQIRAAVSHTMLNEIGYERLTDGPIDELITTNTVPIDTRGLPIKVLSVAPLLAQAILRINNHESVTSLFKIKGF